MQQPLFKLNTYVLFTQFSLKTDPISYDNLGKNLKQIQLLLGCHPKICFIHIFAQKDKQLRNKNVLKQQWADF